MTGRWPDEAYRGAADFIIEVKKSRRQWQCIDCGNVKKSATRPRLCRECWSHNDGPLRQFIRRGACGWFD